MPGVHANQISPAELARTHPALIGSGEWAAAGLPAASNPLRSRNLLLGGGAPATAPQPRINMLTGAPLVVPAALAPVLQQPKLAQNGQVSDMGGTALPGREMHAAVTKVMDPASMSDADIASQLKRFEYVQNVLRGALESDTITHRDALKLVSDAVESGAIPAVEAGEILGNMPRDSANLRAEMQHRHLVGLHGMVALSGEQTKRGKAET